MLSMCIAMLGHLQGSPSNAIKCCTKSYVDTRNTYDRMAHVCMAMTQHHALVVIARHTCECVLQVKQDVARVFGTGWFRACVPDAVDTRDGVKLIIKARS